MVMNERRGFDSDPDKIRLVEPVQRPDGGTVDIWTHTGSDWAYVYAYGVYTGYSREEVEQIGHGNFMVGIVEIGRAYYRAPDARLSLKLDHITYDEIHF